MSRRWTESRPARCVPAPTPDSCVSAQAAALLAADAERAGDMQTAEAWMRYAIDLEEGERIARKSLEEIERKTLLEQRAWAARRYGL